MDVCCELGYFFAQAFQVTKVLEVGILAGGRDWVGVGHGYLH
jgi:hypothetical protein